MKNSRDFEGLPPIKVVGVGGGGCNAVNRMAAEKIPGVAARRRQHRRARRCMHVEADVQIRIGDKLTKGLGAGGDPARGQRAAEESRDELQGGRPRRRDGLRHRRHGRRHRHRRRALVAEVARESGALTIGVVTKPFSFEGTQAGPARRGGHRGAPGARSTR